MEPRLRSRGSVTAIALVGLAIYLQWSRGCEAAEASGWQRCARRRRSFNGAAAAKPRKRLGRVARLLHDVPSMEPRLRSRGSHQDRVLRHPRRRPSMEPRLRSRGSPAPGDTSSTGVTLQWSRGCEAAEATHRFLREALLLPFNGAAAAKPRKRDPHQPSPSLNP